MAKPECWLCGYADWGKVIPQKTLIGTKNVCAEGTGCFAARDRIAAADKARRKKKWQKLFGPR
ncbi:hypothetical protein ACFYOY_13415 [Streptomyces sp. NPDC007875]|uniref:hypothetical protein n=1 Tax=Streptomyces sp. NPDC007875 TaxID=3364783 RepID=UPI00367B8675